MIISKKNNFIFIHISRTGGTSIEELFSKEEKLEIKHISASACKRKVGKNSWDNSFKFTFVRNPYDRMFSYYLWRKNAFNGWEAKGKTFKEWLKFIKSCRDGKNKIKDDIFNLAIQQQFDQISENNKPIVDFIGRFEDLQEDFNKICDKICIPRKKLPHVFKQVRKHYSNYYDKKTKDLVYDLYRKDIEYFKYKFEKENFLRKLIKPVYTYIQEW